MPGCRKCGCQEFRWNPVSAGQKLFSGGSVSGTAGTPNASVSGTLQGQPVIDNKSDQAAYRNCMCGHHANYH